MNSFVELFLSISAVITKSLCGRFGLMLTVCLSLCAATSAGGPASSSVTPPVPVVEPAKSRPAEPEPLPFEQRPYRVRLVVSFGNDSSQLPAQRKTLRAELEESADRFLGPMWQVASAEDTDFAPNGAEALRRLSVAEIKPRLPKDGLDKLFLLTVESEGAGYRLTGREWDAATDQLSPARDGLVYQRREIVEGWLSLVQELFRPVANVEQSRSGAISLRSRAGELAPQDIAWTPLRAGQMLETYHRFLSGKRSAGGIQSVPWTYLVVDRVDRGWASCHLLSGLRSPLPAQRRVETFALNVRRDAPTTRLALVSRRPASKPLVGMEVEVTGDPKQKSLRLVSDREGVISVPFNPTHPQLWLTIRSGQALLARLPFVPGAHGAEAVELPDDGLRLSVEGALAALQADLVDAVARRAVLASTLRGQARAGDWKQVDALLKQLAEAPKASDFATRLNAIRLPALEAAREQKQPDVAARIQKLCDESGELISRYLSDTKLRDVADEVSELRKVSTEDRAANAQFTAEKKKKKKGAKPVTPATPANPKVPAKGVAF